MIHHRAGLSEAEVEEILDYGGCFAVVIGALKDKCLINISDYGTLGMHDLLEEMALEIVRHKQPEEQSRLWDEEDICDVLRKNTGTPTIEAIFLYDDIGEDIDLEPDVFQKMKNLRLLQIVDDAKFHFPRGLYSFPNSIRYLDWWEYPLDSLGSHFTPHNLVNLDMCFSQLERLWNGSKHNLENLKFINLSNSKKLKCLPNLSSANLSRLDLEYCTSLVELPPLSFETKEIDEESTDDWEDDDGIHNMLNLRGCSNLKTLSKMSGNIKYINLRSTAIEELHSSIGSLNNLRVLNLKDCKCLKDLPVLPPNLKALYLSGRLIKQVDESSFEHLLYLKILDMYSCLRLETLSTSICKLKSLSKLDLSGWSEFNSFPEILEPMELLDQLLLGETGIKELPSSIENLNGLTILDLSECKDLESIPTSICKLKSLSKLDLYGCSKFNSFPEILEHMELLDELLLGETGIKELPSSIENLNGLTILDLRQCEDLESIPTSIYKLKSLSKLDLSGCSKFNSFPEILEPMELLDQLLLDKTGIKELPSSIENLNGLTILDLSECKDLESIPISICKLKSLSKLYLYGCLKFNSFPEILEPMELLDELLLDKTGIKELPSSIENLNGLTILDLRQCEDLESIPTSICKLKSLSKLDLSSCSKFNSFPEILEPMELLDQLLLGKTGIKELPSSIENLNGLKTLDLWKCKNLKSIPTSIFNIKCLKHLQFNASRRQHLPAIFGEYFESITACLSYRNILKLCDSQSNLSFLQMLDPSDTIRICIIRKRNQDDKSNMSFTICKCGWSTAFPKRCKLFLEKHFGGDHWTEGSTRFTCYRCSILTEFSYCTHCYSFDEVCNILETEFRRTVLHMATASVFKHGIQEADHPRINISYPRNKIPEWFIDHATGSSIDVNFSPLPHDSSFLGFALCIVVDCEENWFCNSVYWEISCEYHFKTKDGESHQTRWTLQRGDFTYPHVYESEYLNKVSMSSQVFIWHLYEDDYHDYHDATGASFKFYINKQSDDSFGLLHRIKECGIRRLTLQDAEEFGINKPVLAENINSNINEPHRKRLKSLS